MGSGGEGVCVWHEAMVLVCLPLAAPVGLSPLHVLTLCGSERVLVVSTEPPDDLSCLTTPGVGRPRDGGGRGGRGAGQKLYLYFEVKKYFRVPTPCVLVRQRAGSAHAIQQCFCSDALPP